VVAHREGRGMRAREVPGLQASPARGESEPPGWFARSRSLQHVETSKEFDFREPVAYHAEAKRLFHSRARSQLRRIATALGLEPGSYDLRSNQAGIAVSGEITLHGDHLYVQVFQSAMGHEGITFVLLNDEHDSNK
jgi:hypothetical protein